MVDLWEHPGAPKDPPSLAKPQGQADYAADALSSASISSLVRSSVAEASSAGS
jgi:hypothetical protein